MVVKMKQPTSRRVSLPLTEADERDLAMLRSESKYQAALQQMADVDIVHATESVTVHAVFTAGLVAIRNAAEEASYAEVALQQAVDRQSRRTQSRRRQPTWAHEE